MSANVIRLSPAPSAARVVNELPAEVVNLKPLANFDRAEASHKHLQRCKLWDRAWREFQAYKKVEGLMNDLCAIARREGEAPYLFKEFGYLIRQAGAPWYHEYKESAVRLLLTPAPNPAALKWKRAKVSKRNHSLRDGELKSALAMIEADQTYLDLAASRRKGRRGRGKAAH